MAARTSGVCLGQQQTAEEVGHVETVTGMEGVGHGQMEKAQAGLAVLQAQVVLDVLAAFAVTMTNLYGPRTRTREFVVDIGI